MRMRRNPYHCPYILADMLFLLSQGRVYLIMDYFPGGQFLDLLQHHAPFNPDAYTMYTGEIVLALAELHGRGIVHRDLKPENILVDSQVGAAARAPPPLPFVLCGSISFVL